MDFYRKYQEIIADYNREKDRATVEATFAQIVALAASLDEEQRRAAHEGLSDDELVLFDLLMKEEISKADRERLKQASKALLASLRALLLPISEWTRKAATQAEVKVFILDRLYEQLPRPPCHGQSPIDLAVEVVGCAHERPEILTRDDALHVELRDQRRQHERQVLDLAAQRGNALLGALRAIGVALLGDAPAARARAA
jgi:hypothetical protein